MSYLLDTNTIIALIEGRPPIVREAMAARVAPSEIVLIPSIVAFELWYGAAKSRDRARNRKELSAFLSAKVQIIEFDAEDAKVAGEVRARLAIQGTPIGPYDVLIAGQALRRRATLVTSNVREFRRVEGLMMEDWAASTG